MDVQELIDKQASKPGFRGKINAKCIDCIYETPEALAGRGDSRLRLAHHTNAHCILCAPCLLARKTKINQ